MFGRQPRTPGVINITQEGGDDRSVVVEVTEDHLEAKTAAVADLHAKIYQNIKNAQDRQKKEYESRKRRHVKSFHFKVGDEVMKANKRKEGRKGGRLEANWSGPYVIASLSEKGVATLLNKSGSQLKQSINVSQLKPFISPELRESKEPDMSTTQGDIFQAEQEPGSSQLVTQQATHDHDYVTGQGCKQTINPVQAMLLNYVLDKNRSGTEIVVKDGDVCLTREDFWSLGLPQCMEANIGNACFRLVKEAAQRHGIDVHILDMYAVPTLKTKIDDPMTVLPGDIFSKDVIIIPAWSRQPGKPDHYLLC
ncbi:gypsy retrotransposon integrase-like protein 1 isoform X1 [Nothobranchius furzeri]|uniref:gypsy retrotransposon integrase-like protein 1 isoform X1 n=1 Tax=Nothobranchius furzeri TaxID=105023 RepID=UPI003904CA20